MFTIRSMMAAGLLVAAGSAMAADGTIEFTGQITDQTCDITTPGGEDFTVNLPTVAASSLSAPGNVAGRTPFSISLSDCAEGSVATYFEPGPTVNFDTGRLENTAAADAASNVQIQLLGENSQFVPVLAGSVGPGGAQTNSQWVEVSTDGAAALNYYAEYYALGQSTAGNVSSNVQYTIIYQ